MGLTVSRSSIYCNTYGSSILKREQRTEKIEERTGRVVCTGYELLLTPPGCSGSLFRANGYTVKFRRPVRHAKHGRAEDKGAGRRRRRTRHSGERRGRRGRQAAAAAQPLAIYWWYDIDCVSNRNLDLRRRTNRSSMSADSTPTMSTVTLCPPSISDGAIKLRIVKSLLRKFRGTAWSKCHAVQEAQGGAGAEPSP